MSNFVQNLVGMVSSIDNSPVSVPQIPPSEEQEQQQSGQIDSFLLTALNNPRDRLTLLKLDRELERFISDPSRVRLDFPPMTSYQRLMVHRVAQYFKLGHSAVELDGLKRAVVLFKTPETSIPVLRFDDLIEQPEEQPSKSVKIMIRNRDIPKSQRTDHSLNGHRQTQSSQKSVEEREEEYAKARARIFKEESEGNFSDIKSSKDSSIITNDSELNSGIMNTSPKLEPSSSQKNSIIPSEKSTTTTTLTSKQQQQQQQQTSDTMVETPNDVNSRMEFSRKSSAGGGVWGQNPLYYVQPPSNYPAPGAPGNLWSFYGSEFGGNMDYNNLLGYPYANHPPPHPPPSYGAFYMVPYGVPYDYERRPPKSTELFDPNTPSPPPSSKVNSVRQNPVRKRQQIRHYPTSMIDPRTMEMSSGEQYITSPSLSRSPSHDSFFNQTTTTTTINSTSMNYEYVGDHENSLLYDYSTNQSHSQLYIPPATTISQTKHILEICNLAQIIEGMPPEQAEGILSQVKNSGATIKWLNNSTVIAIYKTALAAQEALNQINRKGVLTLRPWN